MAMQKAREKRDRAYATERRAMTAYHRATDAFHKTNTGHTLAVDAFERAAFAAKQEAM